MISDRDIWIAANEVIKTYDDPVFHAAGRIDELLDAGDLDGCAVWRRILDAIKELQNTESDGAVH